MTLPKKNPIPQRQFPIVGPKGAAEQNQFYPWMFTLDALVVAMAAGNLPVLIEAADDAAAAAAGVGLGQVYRGTTSGAAPHTVSVLQVRVT
jgi:hypothetical protein